MTTIPQSTAYVVMFKAFLATDHVTEATGKTIAITISKNGGAFGNPNAGATNATEVSSGWYKVSLDTTDTATIGPLAIRGAVATIDDIGVLYDVQAAFATAAALATVDGIVDDIKAKTDALPSDPADASDIAASFTTVNTKLDTIDDFLDTEIAAIKTETASIQADTDNIQTRLPAALVSGKMDSSVVSITSVTGSVGSVTGAVGSVTGNVGGNVNGNVVGSVGSVVGAIASVTTVGSVTGAVGSVTGNVGGNVTGSVGSMASNGITAASLASDASLEIADALLTRDMSAVTEGSGRTPLQAFRVLRNKWSITAGTLTVTKENDTTASWTAAVTGTAGADPITTVDPA